MGKEEEDCLDWLAEEMKVPRETVEQIVESMAEAKFLGKLLVRLESEDLVE